MISGYVKPGFEPVKAAFEQNFQDRDEIGAAFAAIQDGEMVVNLCGGFSDRKRETPWNEDTTALVFSTTKPIAALVVGYVVSNNPNITYDTPVSSFWPEFSAGGKEAITIGDVLAHKAGLSGFVDEIDAELWYDPPGIITKLAAEKPIWPYDGTSGYHPLTWGYLVSEIVLRLSGKSVGTVLAEAFTGTNTDMPDIDFRIGTPEREHQRMAQIQQPRSLPNLGPSNPARKAAFMTKWAAPRRGDKKWFEIEVPSANGIGTALGVAQLYSIYANDGRLGDVQLIDPETWSDAMKVRASGPDRVLPFNLEFRAGVMRNTNLFFGKNIDNSGHAGWGGSAAFGDTDQRLSAAYVMNRQSNHLLGDPRSITLFDALYDCL